MSRQTKFNIDWLKDPKYLNWVGKIQIQKQDVF